MARKLQGLVLTTVLFAGALVGIAVERAFALVVAPGVTLSAQETLLPSGDYQYTYQLFENSGLMEGGSFSIPDPGNITFADTFVGPIPTYPCGPNGASQCPNEFIPQFGGLFGSQISTPGLLTWFFQPVGGGTVGTGPFGIITTDPPVVETGMITEVNRNTFAFMVSGPVAPTPVPEPSSALLILSGIAGLAAKRFL